MDTRYTAPEAVGFTNAHCYNVRESHDSMGARSTTLRAVCGACSFRARRAPISRQRERRRGDAERTDARAALAGLQQQKKGDPVLVITVENGTRFVLTDRDTEQHIGEIVVSKRGDGRVRVGFELPREIDIARAELVAKKAKEK